MDSLKTIASQSFLLYLEKGKEERKEIKHKTIFNISLERGENSEYTSQNKSYLLSERGQKLAQRIINRAWKFYSDMLTL